MSETEDRPSIPDPNEFESGDGNVGDRVALRSAFSETLSQHGFSDTLVLSRERAADLFHERRLAILDHLKDHDPSSVRDLAASLNEDKGVVSRDLQTLASIDVVEFDEVGRAKAPRLKHAHVVIEPVV
jgi:predicted transcriptional regulator